MDVERQSCALPCPQPVHILRGHGSQIHSIHFARQNSRLVTGDVEGWVVFWKVETKRALVVWKAHEGAILRTAAWGHDRIITHGRDNSLRIWQLRPSDETALSNVLPAEPIQSHRPKPWLLYTLPVNTLNFCAFSMCYASAVGKEEALLQPHAKVDVTALSDSTVDSILIAVPARDEKRIQVWQFPDEKLRFLVPPPESTDTGMTMAVKLVHHATSGELLILAGYEGGFATVHRLPRNTHASKFELAQLVYLSQPHTQPILSLDASPDTRLFFTSSADAVLAAHRIPELPANFKHDDVCPQNGLEDYDAESKQAEVAQLAHKSPTCRRQANVDLAETLTSPSEPPGFPKNPSSPRSTTSPDSFPKISVPPLHTKPSPLSRLSALHISSSPAHPPQPVTLQSAYQTINTKHAGQQSLRVRSDGRLIVTGGWDKRIRVYSSKTLKEVAVLKWHKEGVYAVAFSDILTNQDLNLHAHTHHHHHHHHNEMTSHLVHGETGLARLQRRRQEQAQLTHWIAAGAKDGKVSLWHVF